MNPAMIIRIAANLEELRRNLAEGRNQIEATTAGMKKLAASLDGSKLEQRAHNIVAAINQVGGVSKLSAAEASRMLTTLDSWIDKANRVGKTVPTDMQKTRDALKRVVDEAEKAPGLFDQITMRSVALGSAIGSFLGNAAWSAVRNLTEGVGELVTRGTQIAGVESSFRSLAAGIDQSADAMLGSMRSATKGLVSDFDLMASANKAMMLGLPVTADAMGELAKTATVLGRAMKLDATKSLDDLITALGRSSPMILDNLGLTVKVSEANEQYARSLRKSVDQLTDGEKKLAFYHAALEAARKKVAELGDIQLTLSDRLQILKVRVQNWTDSLSVAIAQSPVLNAALASITEGIDRAFGPDNQKSVEAITRAIEYLVKTMVGAIPFIVDAGQLVVSTFYKAQSAFNQLAARAADIEREQQEKTLQILRDLVAKGETGFADQIARIQSRIDYLRGFSQSLIQDATAAQQNAKAAQDLAARAQKFLAELRAEMAQASNQQVTATRTTRALAAATDELSAASDKAATKQKDLREKLLGIDKINEAKAVLDAFKGAIPWQQLSNEQLDSTMQLLADALAAYHRLGIAAPESMQAAYASALHAASGVRALTLSLKEGQAMLAAVTGITPRNDDLTYSLDPLKNLKVAQSPFSIAARNDDIRSGTARLFEAAFGSPEQFGQDLSKTIVGAIQGGGKAIEAAGSLIGSNLMAGWAKQLTTKGVDGAAATLSGWLGGAAQAVLPVVGSLLGPLVNKIGSVFANIFDRNKGRDMVEKWVQDQFGSFDAFHKKLQQIFDDATAERYWKMLTQGVGRNNPEQAQRAIDTITAAMERQQAIIDKSAERFRNAASVMEEYGFSFEDAGEKFRAMKLGEELDALYEKTLTLKEVGIDYDEILRRQASQYSELVKKAISTHTEIDASMRPVLQRLAEMGLLVDEATGEFIDLEKVTWAKTMSEGFDQVTAAVDRLTDALLNGAGRALDRLGRGVHIPISYDLPSSGPAPDGPVFAASGFHGMVHRPTMFIAGEAGSERVDISPAGRSGTRVLAPIQVQVNRQTLLEVLAEAAYE